MLKCSNVRTRRIMRKPPKNIPRNCGLGSDTRYQNPKLDHSLRKWWSSISNACRNRTGKRRAAVARRECCKIAPPAHRPARLRLEQRNRSRPGRMDSPMFRWKVVQVEVGVPVVPIRQTFRFLGPEPWIVRGGGRRRWPRLIEWQNAGRREW